MKNKQKRLIIITISVILAILLIYLTIQYFKRITYDPEKPYQTVKEAVNTLGHKYIKEEKSEVEEFNKDIFVTFSVDLYTNERSNQNIYYDLIYTIAKVEKYKSFRLIDTEKEIVINVLANEQEKKLTRIYINGNDNYYGRQESLNTIDKYEETPVTDFIVNSTILKEIIQKNWSTNINLPQEYIKEEQYKIYETEGIKIKNVNNKIFNIVFTEEYNQSVVNEIKVGTNIWDVVNILGNPTFGELSNGLIGYQGKEFIIFFSSREISIYPSGKNYDKTEFSKLVQIFTEQGNAKEFVNNVTNLWKDYDYYEYDENHVDLRYSLKGVEIQFNITSNHGIIIYSNYEGSITNSLNTDNLNSENIPEQIYFKRNVNLIYKTEVERWMKVAKKQIEQQYM